MNWNAISATADILSAVGVMVSLVYVAYQIRQNTRAMRQSERTARAAAFNASATSYRENRKALYENAEITKLFLKGLANPESLDEISMYRFRLILLNFIDGNLDVYTQSVQTGYSPETWEHQGRSVLKRVLQTPGGEWFWNAFGSDYPEHFRREISGIVKE
jgi:hypothetical protein